MVDLSKISKADTEEYFSLLEKRKPLFGSDLDSDADLMMELSAKIAAIEKKAPWYSPEHQTILKKYSEQPKTIKKLFGKEPTIVTDGKGNTWYEFDIPKKFKAYELVDRKTYDKHKDESYGLFDERLLRFLDALSSSLELNFHKKIRLVCNNWHWHKNPNASRSNYFQWRGLRTINYSFFNVKSYHAKGMAVDLDSPDISSKDLINYVIEHQHEDWCKDIGGIEVGVNWLHVDVRPRVNGLIVQFKS
jgi:hypothetical protein